MMDGFLLIPSSLSFFINLVAKKKYKLPIWLAAVK